MKKIIYLIFIVSFLSISWAAGGQTTRHSEDLTEKQWQIINQVMAADGTINESMHTQFWDEMPQQIKDEWNSNLPQKIWLSKQLKLTQEYQQALWESALLSYQNNKVIKNEALVRLEDSIKNNFTQFNDASQSSNINRKLQASFSHAEQLLLAAAEHSFLKANGKEILINEDLINQVLKGLNESMERLNILMNPQYYSKNNDTKITTPAHVQINTNSTRYQQSFLSCSIVAVQSLEYVSDYLNAVPLEKVLDATKEIKTARNNAPLVYKLIKEKGLKTTLFSIHLSLINCVKSIPDYINKYKSDPYGLCAWNEANDLLILLDLDSGKTPTEIKNLVPTFLHEKVNALSEISNQKNIESALIEVSNIFKDCVIKIMRNEKRKTIDTYQ